MKIGVITEDESDFTVLEIIASKIIQKRSFSFKKTIAHGCGALRKNCGKWAHLLQKRGCELLIVVHDLDRNDEIKLRAEIETKTRSTKYRDSLILIPKEELEAWLLADPTALKKCFQLPKTPKTPVHPEQIKSPKEFLRDLIWKHGKKRYVNTVHNSKIAVEINPLLLEKCNSFTPYPIFLLSHFKPA